MYNISRPKKLNLLNDRSFRVLLNNAYIFKLILESILESPVNTNTLYSFNNTIVSTVEGKEIILDSILNTENIIYNL